MVRKVARILVAVFVLFSLARPASAQVGMGNCALFAASSGAPGTLVELYPSTAGVVRTVGTMPQGLTAMAQHPLTGVVYATTANVPSSFSRDLVIVNIGNAALTTVGAIGLGGAGIADIAFRSDGTLFGWSESSDDLVTINTATGAATVVGNAGVSTRGSGLEFLQDGRLLLTGNNSNGALRQVDPATGLTTVIGTLTGAPASGLPVNAMTMAPDGGLWASMLAVAPPANPQPTFLIRINPATAVVTNVGSGINRMDALAWICAAAVPTMSDWLLWLTAASVLAAAAWQIRRRRHVIV